MQEKIKQGNKNENKDFTVIFVFVSQCYSVFRQASDIQHPISLSHAISVSRGSLAPLRGGVSRESYKSLWI